MRMTAIPETYLNPERVISRDGVVFRKAEYALLKDEFRLRGSHVGGVVFRSLLSCAGAGCILEEIPKLTGYRIFRLRYRMECGEVLLGREIVCCACFFDVWN